MYWRCIAPLHRQQQPYLMIQDRMDSFFCEFTPNSDPAVWLSQQTSRLIKPGDGFFILSFLCLADLLFPSALLVWCQRSAIRQRFSVFCLFSVKLRNGCAGKFQYFSILWIFRLFQSTKHYYPCHEMYMHWIHVPNKVFLGVIILSAMDN